MSKDSHHSEQLERYLRGQMSPEEANAFERAMLDDPFALEALEGFESQGIESMDDIQLLRRKISSKKRGVAWWKIATAAILILVSGLTVYFSSEQLEDTEELALEEPKKEVSEQEENNPVEEEIEAEELSTEVLEEEVSSVGVVELPDEESPEESIAGEEEIEEELLVADNEYFPEEDQEVKRTDVDEEIVTNENIEDALRGRVAGVAITPIGISDSIKVDLSEEGLTQTLVAQESEESAPPILQIRGTSSLAKSRSLSADDSVTEEVPTNSPAIPITGTGLFNRYIETNLQYPASAQANKIKGTVTLELTISSTGEISNIDVKKSLGYGCDEEAIRLIKEGPDWNPAYKNGIQVEDKVKVKVEFKLD